MSNGSRHLTRDEIKYNSLIEAMNKRNDELGLIAKQRIEEVKNLIIASPFQGTYLNVSASFRAKVMADQSFKTELTECTPDANIALVYKGKELIDLIAKAINQLQYDVDAHIRKLFMNTIEQIRDMYENDTARKTLESAIKKLQGENHVTVKGVDLENMKNEVLSKDAA